MDDESTMVYALLQQTLITLGAMPSPALSSACLLLAARIHQTHSDPTQAKAMWMERCESMWQHV